MATPDGTGKNRARGDRIVFPHRLPRDRVGLSLCSVETHPDGLAGELFPSSSIPLRGLQSIGGSCHRRHTSCVIAKHGFCFNLVFERWNNGMFEVVLNFERYYIGVFERGIRDSAYYSLPS
jgi:hypothetical protein